MKRGAIDHPKMRRLARLLSCPHLLAVGVMESLWHWAARYAPAGDIGRHPDQDIAEGIGWDGDAQLLVTSLVQAGFLDADDVHRLRVHDWDEHADDAIHMQLARAGKFFASGKPPKLNRLSKEERERVSAHFVRTANARRAHGKRTKSALPEPSPPLPSQSPLKGLSSTPDGADPPASVASPLSPTELAEGWNELVASRFHLPKVTLPLSPDRSRKAKLRCQEHPDDGWWGAVFGAIGRSKFLRGEHSNGKGGHAGWRVSFDFLIDNATNAQKIHEGQYAH